MWKYALIYNKEIEKSLGKAGMCQIIIIHVIIYGFTLVYCAHALIYLGCVSPRASTSERNGRTRVKRINVYTK